MSNDIQVKPENRIEGLLSKGAIRSRFDEVLGKKSAGFVSSIISAYKTDALKNAEPMSVVSAAMVAATLDLPINQSLGQAYIVAYGGVAQFQLGYKGYIQLAMRSGQYKTINATPIYDGQIKNHNSFTGEMELQEQKLSNTIIGYLLYFKLLNGFEKFFYMTKDEVEAHGKRYSQMYKKGAGLWKTDFDAMALKTVIKMGLSKFGVLSVELQKAIVSDEGVIDLPTGDVTAYPDALEAEKTEPKTKSDGLAKAVTTIDPPSPDLAETIALENEEALLMDFKTAIGEASSEETIDKLFNEVRPRLSADGASLLFAHVRQCKRKLKG
jgi:recombination protein RecT